MRDLVDAVKTWNDNISQFSVLAFTNPPTESRIQAMGNTTIHDVLNAVDRRFEPYAYDGHVTRPLSVEAAIATGAYEVLASIGQGLPTPDALNFITQAYTDYMAALEQCDEVTRGVALGHDAAAAMIALRAGDGSVGPPAVVFTSTGEAGKFRSTIATATALTGPQSLPYWGSVRPFVMASGSQFRAGPMYRAATVTAAVQTRSYLADYAEVKRLGGQVSERTPEQTDIGYFWLGGHAQSWNTIARQLAAKRHLNAWRLSRLLSHVALARADALISGFESAYYYNFWRPITAIRLGNLDPATPGDVTWQAATFSIADNGPTPPFPAHSAAPTVAAQAAAQVILADLDGPTGFTLESITLPGKPRSFPVGRSGGAGAGRWAGLWRCLLPAGNRRRYRAGSEGRALCSRQLTAAGARALRTLKHSRAPPSSFWMGASGPGHFDSSIPSQIRERRRAGFPQTRRRWSVPRNHCRPRRTPG